MTTSTDRVALILDVLGHDDTELTGQTRLWRHRDGRYLTEDEAEIASKCTLGEIRQAMDLWHEELVHMQEQNELRGEYLAIFRTFAAAPDEPVLDIMCRLPQAEMKRAAEIWQRIGPSFEARRQDES